MPKFLIITPKTFPSRVLTPPAIFFLSDLVIVMICSVPRGGGGGGGGGVSVCVGGRRGWGVTSYIWHSMDARAEWPPFSALPGIWLPPTSPFFNKKVYDWHGPEAIKLFSCSTQLSMKFVLLIKLRIMTKVWNFFHDQLSWARSAELSIKKFQLLVFLFLWPSEMSCSVELSMKKV